MKLKSEKTRRNSLKENKPLVYKKVRKFKDKLAKGESIALIQLQYSYACNLNCEHCCTRRFQKEVKNRRKLTPFDVKNLFDQADKMGLARVTITGGEPLVFHDFKDLVEAIGPKRFWINCDTNGWFLTKKRAKKLKKMGVDRIQLSIDNSDAKEHDKWRGRDGSHKRAMEAVDAALEAGLSIFIQTMGTHERIKTKELKDFIKYFNKKGIGVYVNYPKPVGAFEGHFESLVTKDDMKYMVDELEKMDAFTHLTPAYGINMGCISVKGIISITQFGDVMPCPWIPISLGNIFEEKLKKIIKRGLDIKHFGEWEETCLAGEDRNFIHNYLVKTYGKELPVKCDEIFTKEDKTKKPFHEDKRLFS